MNDDNEGTILPGVWPGEVELEGIVSSELTPEQDARATALFHARMALEKRGGGGLAGNGNASTPPPVTELLRVARYIISGEG